MRCALGRSGVSARKREGDGASPAGIFPLRRVLYRADRLAAPATGLPAQALEPEDGWCDDPDDPAYNSPVRLPRLPSRPPAGPTGAEALWREDALYDILVVVGFNDDPPVPGAGSAIFLHLARPDYAPTEGCVAVSEADMRRLLAASGPGATLEIRA